MRIELSTIAGDLDALQRHLTQLENNLDTQSTHLRALRQDSADLGLPDAEELLAHALSQQTARLHHVAAVSTALDGFLQTVVDHDLQVARRVDASREAFFVQYAWLRPPAPVVAEEPSLWEQLCDGAAAVWDTAGDAISHAWAGVLDFYDDHNKLINSALIVAGAAASIAAVVATGGAALVPLMGYGFSTGIAATAVGSTLVSSTMNLLDTWCDIDDPTFNFVQSFANGVAIVSDTLYSVGALYTVIKGVSPKEIATLKRLKAPKTEIDNMVKQDYAIRKNHKLLETFAQGDAGLDKIEIANRNTIKGNYGEMLTDKIQREQGFQRISKDMVTDIHQVTHQGIDGVYYNGKDFQIVDAKFGTAQLHTSPDGTRQMSKSWIEKNLYKEFSPDQADLFHALTNSKPSSQIVRISKDNPLSATFEPLKENGYLIHLKDLPGKARVTTTATIPNATTPILGASGTAEQVYQTIYQWRTNP